MKLPKTLENIFKSAILGGALLLSPVSPVQKADAESSPYIALQNNWTLGFGTSFATLSGIPEYMRTVPIHPDDGNGSTIIPDETIEFHPLIGTDLRLGGGVKDRYCDFPYDFNFGFRVGADLLIGGGHSYNYTNHPGTEERGYGAALTKYNCFGLNVNFGGFAKVNLANVAFLEYNIELPIFQGAILQNGWDRFDDFEVRETYALNNPTSLNHTIKIGAELSVQDENNGIGKIGIFFGAKIPQNVFPNQINEFGMTFSPSFFGGIQYTQGLEYRF